MAIIIFTIIFLSFLIVYNATRVGFYVYSLLFPFLGFFLLNKIGYSLAYTIMNTQLLAIIVLSFLTGNFIKYAKYYVLFLGLFFIYFFIDALLQDVSVLTKWNDYKKSIIFMLWGGLLLDDIASNRVSVKTLRHFFLGFVSFELILCVFQYVSEPIRNFFRISYMRNGEMVEMSDVLDAGYMVGTFRGGSTLASFLLMSFSIAAIYIFFNNKFTHRNIFFLVAIELIILLTGIRAALLFSIVLILALVFKYQRKLIIPVFIASIAFYFIGGISFGYVSNLRQVGFEEGGIARSLTLFNSFSGNSLQEQTTFAMSINMVPHVLQNPLLGIGLHYKSGYVLSDWGLTLEYFSMTDAMLLFTIAEIGLIGLAIYLWPLLKFVNLTKRIGVDPLNYKILFYLLILSTIVDTGFMSDNNLLLYFFSIVFFCKTNETPYRLNKLKRTSI